MSSYKLTYFNATALGEPIRLLLHYGGVSFEDVRLDMEGFLKIKESLPLKQVPILEVDGKVVHQSIPIARYLARQFGLAGDTNWDSLEIDIVVSTIDDLRAKLAKVHYEPDEIAKEKNYAIVKETVIPFYLEKLEEIAKTNNGHLALGKAGQDHTLEANQNYTLTWADFFFAGLIGYMSFMARTELTADQPNLKAVVDNALGRPEVAEYIANRPVTEV